LAGIVGGTHLGIGLHKRPGRSRPNTRRSWCRRAMCSTSFLCSQRHGRAHRRRSLIARQMRAAGIKVALSGVGGNEMFAGYSSFREIPGTVALSDSVFSIPRDRCGIVSGIAAIRKCPTEEEKAGGRVSTRGQKSLILRSKDYE